MIIGTHVDPDAPTQPHDPVPFMGSVIDQDVSNAHEVQETMDAIISIDTTRGNRICNHNGIAITPTVAGGWILRSQNHSWTSSPGPQGGSPPCSP